MHYIEQLIEQGEHQQQDFKFAVNDSKKIARSLSAFANTDGGRLLLGVKDNGKIAGVSSDEEFYMIEAASTIHTKPNVEFETKQHKVHGKTVLEITVRKSKNRPHTAPDLKNNHKAFIRIEDKNRLANGLLLKIWEKEKEKASVKIEYTEPENKLLKYLSKNNFITFSKFCKLAEISKNQAENILINFILIDIIEIVFTLDLIFYRLKIKENQ